MCLQTLNDIFVTRCAATLQETPCLCGTLSPASCFTDLETPNGPVYPDYVADFGSDLDTILANFTNAQFGAGMANSIVQCLGAYACECF
jgi:hypothetical protein